MGGGKQKEHLFVSDVLMLQFTAKVLLRKDNKMPHYEYTHWYKQLGWFRISWYKLHNKWCLRGEISSGWDDN